MSRYPPLSCRITRDTIADVIHRFYTRVMSEPRLSPFFSRIDDWPEHESYITDFWWGVMGGKVNTHRPNAMESGHRHLAFSHQALNRWLDLFEQTLHENLPADIAEQWDTLARQIGNRMIERGMVRTDR